jgi:hypothetical protein
MLSLTCGGPGQAAGPAIFASKGSVQRPQVPWPLGRPARCPENHAGDTHQAGPPGIRTGALLIAIGLIRLARAVQIYWRPLLAGGVLTVGGLDCRTFAGLRDRGMPRDAPEPQRGPRSSLKTAGLGANLGPYGRTT